MEFNARIHSSVVNNPMQCLIDKVSPEGVTIYNEGFFKRSENQLVHTYAWNGRYVSDKLEINGATHWFWDEYEKLVKNFNTFEIGERVMWTLDGERYSGTVFRTTPKTIFVNQDHFLTEDPTGREFRFSLRKDHSWYSTGFSKHRSGLHRFYRG